MNKNYKDKEDFFQKLRENYDDIQQINNSGGGGIIYQGIHRRLKKKVILKKIRADKISIIGSEREKQILMNLKHSYLPGIVDFWVYEDEIYTVMEFIEGRSFKELLDEGQVFSEKDVIKWIKQLAEVMAYLHKEHIIHSDIKPANIMLTSKNNICLIDFNVSILQGEQDETIGYSPAYSPIEQLIQQELVRGRKKIRKECQDNKKKDNVVVAADNESTELLNDDATKLLYNDVTELLNDDATKLLYNDVTELLNDDATEMSDDDATEISDDDATEISDDDVTEISDDDVTEISDDDATEISDDDATEISDDDATEISDDDVTELLDNNRTELLNPNNSVIDTSNKKIEKKVTVKGSSLSSSKRPTVEELVKKYGSNVQVDERSDIYSACATMYHILTGQKPKHCYEKQIHVEKCLPSVNDALAYIIMHGMEQDPKKRFQNSTQFLIAVNRMMKSTKRYKHLLWKQDFAIIFLVGLFLGSCITTYVGFKNKIEEKLTEKITFANDQYEKMQYDEIILYLEEQILNYPLYQESSQIDQVYYLMGSCYLEQGKYIEAATEYRKAILLDSNQSLYYRDYGIALARSGNLEPAREALSQAEAKGLENDSILLLQGEIASLEGDYLVAINNLKECIRISEQDYVKLSAGLKLNEILELQYKEESYLDRIAVLESLSKEIEKDKKLPIWENLVQVYSDYGQLVKEENYIQLAIETLDEIINSGYSTLAEWLNKAVLLQSIQQYEEAKQCLLDAEGRYPNNYLIYKRLAFLELDMQASYEVNQREYSKFKEYFTISDELYKNSNLKSELDMEMEYLYQIYDEIVVKGWLEE